jgi:hypothetical protein
MLLLLPALLKKTRAAGKAQTEVRRHRGAGVGEGRAGPKAHATSNA